MVAELDRAVTDTTRCFRAGYIDLETGEWAFGIAEIDDNAGYYDIADDAWTPGVPDIQTGGWMPEHALLIAEQDDCPPDHPIKGNLPSRIYHLAEQSTYQRTDAEICFASESAAVTAGFRKSQAGNSASSVN